MEQYIGKKSSLDAISAVFVIAFVAISLLTNYYFGFNFALYLISMIVGAALTFFYPSAGLYAIIFLTFIFERFFTLAPIVLGRTEYKLYPIDVLLGALIAGILFQISIGKIKFKIRKIDWAIILFISMSILYFFLSVFVFKGSSSLAFSSSKNYAYYALLYFATFILVQNEDQLKDMLKAIMAGAIGILWFIAYGIFVQHGLWSDFTPLSTEGIRTLAFTHAFYLCMVIIIALVYMAHSSDAISKLMLILMPVWAIGILGSMMRHLWISLFAALLFLIVVFTRAQRQRLKKYAKNYTFIAACIMIVLIYGATLFPRSQAYESLMSGVGMLSERVTSITNTGGDESIIWRKAVWQQSIKQYMHSPLLGIGFGKLVSVEIGKYHDFVEVRNIHNSFLVVLVQMGLVGIGSLLFLIIVLSVKVLRQKYDEFGQMTAYAALGILLMQIVAFMFQPYLEANLLSIFFWINLGVLRRLYDGQIEQV